MFEYLCSKRTSKSLKHTIIMDKLVYLYKEQYIFIHIEICIIDVTAYGDMKTTNIMYIFPLYLYKSTNALLRLI